ncbi:MAG: riboflavin synthase [Thermodesulfobacteriota bacterium]
MFTGIIEDVGSVKSIEKKGPSGRIGIETTLDLSGIRTGDSIAVDGSCLTVTRVSKGSFMADLSDETLRVTTLGSLESGARVNIEPALTLSRPLGGHMVTGHVDGVGTIVRKARRGEAMDLEVSCPAELMGQIVKKGSVAVDGISLTVAELLPGGFRVAVIPHTMKRTTLPDKREGARVNIETDVIGKYVEKYFASGSKGITEDFLSEHGFFRR